MWGSGREVVGIACARNRQLARSVVTSLIAAIGYGCGAGWHASTSTATESQIVVARTAPRSERCAWPLGCSERCAWPHTR